MVAAHGGVAGAIKAVAPGALVFGPVSYGWQGFVRLQDAPDNGGRDFLDFYLDAMRDAEGRARRRLVDVLDLHWYPEARGGGVRITEANNAPEVAAARVQAPRSLWDPSYAENSWISVDARVGAIRLLPRMKEKIAAHYPGTRLAITEYNYGGGDHVSGGVAQADALGIFGREDVFAAALWDLQGGMRYVDGAFALFCNYDGAGGRFGDTSIGAATSNHETTSIYASVDEGRDDRMVLVAVNKSTGPTTAEILLTHPVDFARGQTWQIGAASSSPARGPDLAPDRAQRLPTGDAGLERDHGRPHPLTHSPGPDPFGLWPRAPVPVDWPQPHTTEEARRWTRRSSISMTRTPTGPWAAGTSSTGWHRSPEARRRPRRCWASSRTTTPTRRSFPRTTRASPRRASGYDVAGTKVGGYLARMKGGGKRPAVIVIHENRGLNPHIQDVARRLAVEGFLAFAVDALSPLGGTPADEDKAREMIGTLDRTETLARVAAAVPFLAGHAESNGKVGAVGFCWGGAMANRLAAAGTSLAASVAYYGMPLPSEEVPRISAALLLHYAGLDERINAGGPRVRGGAEGGWQDLRAAHVPGRQPRLQQRHERRPLRQGGRRPRLGPDDRLPEEAARGLAAGTPNEDRRAPGGRGFYLEARRTARTARRSPCGPRR